MKLLLSKGDLAWGLWCPQVTSLCLKGITTSTLDGKFYLITSRGWQILWETVKDQGALHAAVHGVTKNQTRLSNNNICIHRSFFSCAICKKTGKPLLLEGSMINLGNPGGSVVKNLLANARDAGVSDSIPGLGRSPGGRKGNPLQYSCLENLTDRGAWWTAFHRIAKSWHK